MPISFLTTALLIISLFTNLTVEGAKKLLDETSIKYSSNILAAIFSVVIAGITCAVYLIMNDLVFSMKIGVQILVLMYLGFLTSTVGYDKILQTIIQIQQSANEPNKGETKNGSNS